MESFNAENMQITFELDFKLSKYQNRIEFYLKKEQLHSISVPH